MRGEYLALLLGSVGAVALVDWLGGLGVLRQGRRLLIALTPVVALVLGWDLLGVVRWGWSSNRALLTGLYGFGGRIPLEEFLFPVVVGICALVVWELVQRRVGRER